MEDEEKRKGKKEERENDLVEFGVGGALCGDKGAMVLDQNGDDFLK